MTSHPKEVLFLSEKFSDVTFLVETQSIPAHKLLLATSCPYFENMLFGSTNEAKMSVIEIKNVTHKEFLEVIRSVYVRKVVISEWTPEEVKKLAQIADEYQFTEMGRFLAEAADIDTQITIDVIEELLGVAKRLNCSYLMELCIEAARKRTEFLFSKEDAFDKLPMDFIVHLLETEVWSPADARLVYSIGNWRKTASIEDKKGLLSKMDWKALAGKYSEPLVRMLLEDDREGLQSKDWTKGLKKTNSEFELIACVYLSKTGVFFNDANDRYVIRHILSNRGYDVLDNSLEKACVFFIFREQVSNVRKITFSYSGLAIISLRTFGDNDEKYISGTNNGNDWEFRLPSKVNLSTAVFQIQNEEFENKKFSNYNTHRMYNVKFHSF